MNIIFLSPVTGGIGANQVQQRNVLRRNIDKSWVENKSLKNQINFDSL